MVQLIRVFVAFMIAFNPAAAYAVTDENRYVTTTCSSFNGNGMAASCAASNGAVGAYQSCQLALTDIASDHPSLVTADKKIIVNLAGATVDDGGVSNAACHITGLTMDSTRFLVLKGDGTYHLRGASYFGVIWLQEEWVTIENLRITNNKTAAGGGTGGAGILMQIGAVTSGRLIFDRNKLVYTGDYTNQSVEGFDDDDEETSGVTKVFRNNWAQNWKVGYLIKAQDAGVAVYAYNNTNHSTFNSNVGFRVRGYGAGSTIHLKNSLTNGSNQTGYDFEVPSSSTDYANNLSEDATSPNNTYDSVAVTFVNEAGGDFHLAAGDAVARISGADLSAATNGFAIDIDNEARVVPWSIGADEYISGATVKPFSVLQAMGAL